MKNIILLSGVDKTKYFNENISAIIKENISNPVLYLQSLIIMLEMINSLMV